MSLSQSERRQLAAIEEHLERDDTELAHNLRTMSPPRRRLPDRLGIAMVLLAFVLLTAIAWAARGPTPHRETPSMQHPTIYHTTATPVVGVTPQGTT